MTRLPPVSTWTFLSYNCMYMCKHVAHTSLADHNPKHMILRCLMYGWAHRVLYPVHCCCVYVVLQLSLCLACTGRRIVQEQSSLYTLENGSLSNAELPCKDDRVLLMVGRWVVHVVAKTSHPRPTASAVMTRDDLLSKCTVSVASKPAGVATNVN